MSNKKRFYVVVGMSESYLEAIERRGWEESLIEARKVLNAMTENSFILRVDTEPILSKINGEVVAQ